MSDCIDRQTIINLLTSRAETLRGLYGDLGGAASGVRKLVQTLPSAEPERKWIPVTEALPDEEKDVLVSVHFEGHKSPTVDLPPSDYVEIASHVDGLWSSLSDEYKVAWKKHHVVAWMPTPEPYRGE